MPQATQTPPFKHDSTNRTLRSLVVDVVFQEVRWSEMGPVEYRDEPIRPSMHKWVYVFVDDGSDLRSTHELVYGPDGTFRRVDWEANTWDGQDTRPATLAPDSTPVGEPCLRLTLPESTRSVYAFLSDVALTRARVERYRRNTDGCLNLRSFEIPYSSVLRDADDDDPSDAVPSLSTQGFASHNWDDSLEALLVVLPDALGIAQQLHTFGYLPAVDKYSVFTAQTEVEHLHAATTSSVAQNYEAIEQDSWRGKILRPIETAAEWLVQPLTSKPPDATVWDWLDRQRIQSTLDTWASEKAQLEGDVNAFGSALYGIWLYSSAYVQALYDTHTPTQDSSFLDDEILDEVLAQSEFLRDASHSAAGRQYLDLIFGAHTSADGALGLAAHGDPTWHDDVFFLSRDALRRTSDVVAAQLADAETLAGRRVAAAAPGVADAEARLARVWDNYREALASDATRVRSTTALLEGAQAQVARWQKLDRHLRGVTAALVPDGGPPALGDDGPGSRALRWFKRNVRSASAAVVDAGRRFAVEPVVQDAQGRASRHAGEIDEVAGTLQRLRAKAQAEEITRTRERNVLRRQWRQLQRQEFAVQTRRLGWAGVAGGLHTLNVLVALDQWRDVRRKHPGSVVPADVASALGVANAVAESVAIFRHYYLRNTARQAIFGTLRNVNAIAAYLEVGYQIASGGNALYTGDTGRAVGHGISLVGALMLLAGPSGWAVAILIAGQVVATAWGDDDVEQWFKHCHWAKRRSQREGTLTTQLDSLFAILLQPRVFVDLLGEDGELARAPQHLDRSRYDGPATLVLAVVPRMFDPGLMTLSVKRLALPDAFPSYFDAVDLVPRVLDPDPAASRTSRRPARRPSLGGPLRELAEEQAPDSTAAPPGISLGPSILDRFTGPYVPAYRAPEPEEDYVLSSDGTIARFEWRWDLRRLDAAARRQLGQALRGTFVFAKAECDLVIQTRGVSDYQAGFQIVYGGLPAYIGPPPPSSTKVLNDRLHWAQRPVGGELGVRRRGPVVRNLLAPR